MKLSSPAFASGGRIPRKYTGDGEDVSPPLAWDDVPPDTQELALICDDPDAPTPQPWVHWVLHQIPAHVRGLPEGASQSRSLPGVEGKNSWKTGRTTGYRGPAPPAGHGPHHYHFRLLALNAPLHLAPQADKEALLAAAKDHTLAQAELVATYERE